jgi:hypothetical protein
VRDASDRKPLGASQVSSIWKSGRKKMFILIISTISCAKDVCTYCISVTLNHVMAA